MYKAIIVALGMALFTIGHLSAQALQSCEPEDRVRAGDLTTPCKPPVPAIESIRYEYSRDLGEIWEGRHRPYCRMVLVIDFDGSHPMPELTSVLSSGWNTHTWHPPKFAFYETSTQLRILLATRRLTDPSFEGETRYGYGSFHWHLSQSNRSGYSWALRGRPTIQHLGKPVEAVLDLGTVSPIRSISADDIDAEMRHCVDKLALDYEFQQEQARLLAEEEDTARAEELKDLASLNAIKIAEEVGRIEARIDALRLEVAKRIDANVIKLNLVLEANIQAGIKMDRQITEVLIETRKKELAALEVRAELVRSWVIDKQDKWDELASLQSDYQTRIDELQDETATSLAELERTKATVSAAIAASEARARELNEQLRTSQADEASLNAQLAAAEAELAEARKRLQALESGDATPTPTPTP